LTTFASEHHAVTANAIETCRARLIDAAIEAYEQAGLSGLCHEGRWECALAALRRTPLSAADPEPAPPER